MSDHHASVGAFLERMGSPSTPERLLVVFEVAFNALWRRAQITLGDVTLTAIVNRVFHRAGERHPAMATVPVSPTGVTHADLVQHLGQLGTGPLEAAIRDTLVELLTVIGTLTAEILTPALHGVLGAVDSPPDTPDSRPTVERNARSQDNVT